MVKKAENEFHDFQISMDQIGITSYEKARMIGARALQLSQGATSKLKLSQEDLEKIKFNPIEIAKLEFEQNVIPIGIKRIKD